MEKTITKYYCDLCGKETRVFSGYYLPERWQKTEYDNSGSDIGTMSEFIRPIPYDLCRHCVELVCIAVENVKKVVTEE